jgi:membrane-associated phospholipid phosphatase
MDPPSVANSYASWPRRLLVIVALLAAAAPLAFFVDVPLAAWAKEYGPPGDLKHVVRLSEVFAHGSGVFLILLAVLALESRSWRVLPRLTIGAYGAGTLADILKLVLARQRPKTFDLNLTVWDSFQGLFAWRDADSLQAALKHDIQSFPSAHAATAAGLACALSRLYPRAAWCFATLTALACFQRIVAGAHYLSDVLAGAAIGVLVNLLLEMPRIRRLLETCESHPD